MQATMLPPGSSWINRRSEPYRQIGFYRIVAGAVRKLPVIGQAERGVPAKSPFDADIEPRLDNADILRNRQAFDVKGLAAGKGQALLRGHIAEGMAPAEKSSRRQPDGIDKAKSRDTRSPSVVVVRSLVPPSPVRLLIPPLS